MRYDRILNTTDQLIMDALLTSSTPLTYEQIAQITGRSHIQVQRRLKVLAEWRYAIRFTKDRTVHWRPNRINELPRINGEPIDEWLQKDTTNDYITEVFWDRIRQYVANVYAQPVIKLSTGKTAPMYEGSLLHFAKELEKIAGLLRYLLETLSNTTDIDFDTWGELADYDPTTALRILKITDPDNFGSGVAEQLLKKWREKKVG